MSATTTVTTPPKPKMTALQRAMLVHELKGEFVSPKTKTEVVKEDVPDVPGAYVLKNVLTVDECKAFIDACEEIQFSEAPVSTFGGPVFSDIRDNQRVMATISNKSLAAIQQRISEFVDKEFEMNGYKWKVLEGAEGLNERLRFYKYEIGTEFKPHYDGCFPRSDEETSFFTFIIYLNGDLDGGQTEFYMENKKKIKVNPAPGQALVFWHRGPNSPFHAGLPHYSAGQSKYVLRSDLMYRRGEGVSITTKKK